MKSVLKAYLFPLFFSSRYVLVTVRIIQRDGDWLLSWIGVLMAYLSLYTLIDLYCKIHTIKNK